MAKYLLLSITLIVVFIAGCESSVNITSFKECVEAGNPVMESYPRQCRANDQTFTENINLKSACEVNGGTWIDDFNECEGLDKETCEFNGGIFSECESACRNDPEAQMCTMQCVVVCDFE
jgi:hypothetical protein